MGPVPAIAVNGRPVRHIVTGAIWEGRRELKQHLLYAAILWALFTLVGEVIVFSYNPLPLVAAEEGEIVDHAFKVLTVMAVPVFAFVVATVAYSVFRFRRRGEPGEDGPPIRGSGPVIATWLVVTTALTVLVIIFPGTTGLLELRAKAKNEDLVVRAEGSRWFWKVTYPEHNITIFGPANELMLPKDRRVRFEVTSTDVVHAFWVPAFRIKIDAVPGRVTTTYANPTLAGGQDLDSGFTLVCAELCGTAHALMKMPVRVVEPDEFDAWVAEKTANP